MLLVKDGHASSKHRFARIMNPPPGDLHRVSTPSPRVDALFCAPICRTGQLPPRKPLDGLPADRHVAFQCVPWRTFGITVIDCVPRSHAPVPQVDGRYIVGLRCMLGVLDIPAPSVHARSFGHPGLFRVRSKDVSAQSWATVRGTMARDLDGNETPCLKIYVSHSAVGPRYTFEDPISC